MEIEEEWRQGPERERDRERERGLWMEYFVIEGIDTERSRGSEEKGRKE